jgi:hypothetical protein
VKGYGWKRMALLGRTASKASSLADELERLQEDDDTVQASQVRQVIRSLRRAERLAREVTRRDAVYTATQNATQARDSHPQERSSETMDDISMEDPQHPDRPQTKDYWKLSEILLKLDGRFTEDVADFGAFLKAIVDKESVLYVADQRALRFESFGLGPLAALWLDGFLIGNEWATEKQPKERDVYVIVESDGGIPDTTVYATKEEADAGWRGAIDSFTGGAQELIDGTAFGQYEGENKVDDVDGLYQVDFVSDGDSFELRRFEQRITL